jgi:hypothetical protein
VDFAKFKMGKTDTFEGTGILSFLKAQRECPTVESSQCQPPLTSCDDSKAASAAAGTAAAAAGSTNTATGAGTTVDGQKKKPNPYGRTFT